MNVTDIFKVHQLSHTENRKAVSDIMLSNKLLSANEIKKLSGSKLHRITVYRCLKTFLSKGIICRLKDDDGRLKYFLNKKDNSNHVHFKCRRCGLMDRLKNSDINYKSLPKGYLILEKSLFIVGICIKCNADAEAV